MTEDQVAEIKRLRASGMSQKAIGDLFGKNQSTISLILSGKSKARKNNLARPDGTKMCSRCGPSRGPIPVSEFDKSKSKPDGLNSFCKPCKLADGRRPEVLEYRRKYRLTERGRAQRAAYYASRKRLARHLEKRYGTTLAEYDAVLERQEHRCPICQTHLKDLDESPHTDHSHTTGKFRGVLCSPCNKGLGLFRDDPWRLLGAIEYLFEAEPALMWRWSKSAATIYDAEGNLVPDPETW